MQNGLIYGVKPNLYPFFPNRFELLSLWSPYNNTCNPHFNGFYYCKSETFVVINA